MGKSKRVTLADLKGLLHLVGELHELPNDPLARMPHLLQRVSEMLGAQVATFFDVKDSRPNEPNWMSSENWGVATGWESPARERIWAESVVRKVPHPTIDAMVRTKGPRVTLRRQDLVSTNGWHGCQLFNDFARPAGLDEHLIFIHALENGRAFLGGFHRPARDSQFNARDRELADTVNREFHWIFRWADEKQSPKREVKLAPRLRRTLDGLLAGDSEKQIAFRLGLSRHTIHEYVKTLYRRHGVSSRGELMACFIESRNDCNGNGHA